MLRNNIGYAICPCVCSELCYSVHYYITLCICTMCLPLSVTHRQRVGQLSNSNKVAMRYDICSYCFSTAVGNTLFAASCPYRCIYVTTNCVMLCGQFTTDIIRFFKITNWYWFLFLPIESEWVERKPSIRFKWSVHSVLLLKILDMKRVAGCALNTDLTAHA